ncbi:hypothetical protein BU23DRAFT_8861 [Bimuria novae-zelandiae CBS 107.79]|uniref:Nonsense-mediated mRNA decay factor n=1 Tax=Bimuria novae-zelandiae CBS 107.79 TaxID=1447943 RepID=A0A6A5W042_9PLEO|nr:hypothetical protein BU23DRAFT_8861 [Bimuria novae-zelandiae CBS 107.79]
MATHTKQLLRHDSPARPPQTMLTDPSSRVRAIEERLTKLAESNASGADLAALLQEYRITCENVIFADFEAASANQVEPQLWSAHLKVNTVFRKENRSLKKHAKERVVELRKFQKSYMQFIKASQRFYRQYILNLDAQFEGIPELRKVAHTWKDDPTRTSNPQRIAASLKSQILHSCYQTLIQLGDLSRYRETELGDEKERKWGPAIGYYNLAADIYPDSGHSHNQLAVIAREDGNHFRVVYHIYRSLASKHPYPQAQGNLELEFKRIVVAWEKGESINNNRSGDGANSTRALNAWFVRLHSKCYKGEEFKEHDELEGEVLSQLAVELKERSLEGALQKIILINLAAEYFSTMQLQGPSPSKNVLKTYFYFLRLNVKTFFTLLQVMQPELESSFEGNDVTQNGDRIHQLSDKITAVARRVLPGLRLYSTWFTRFWNVLNANIADTLTKVEVQELWKAYAATLTLLTSSFPADQLPQDPSDSYLLEEDIETIGFQPLISADTTRLWYKDGVLKPKCTDVERSHPNVEMLMRVRDLLIDGLMLTQNPEAPLDLDGPRFVYREEGLPSELLASPHNRADGSPVMPVEPVDFLLFPSEAPVADDQKSYSVVAASETASTMAAKDSAMNQLVDDLVGPDGLDPLLEEDENIPPTPPEQTFEDTALVSDNTYGPATFSISDLVNTVQNYKKPSGSPATPLMSTPMGRTASTSSMRGPANLPSLPDGHGNTNSIWNRNYNGTSGPASPSMRSNADDMCSSPMNGVRPPPGFSGHVRGDSAASLRSSDFSMASTVQPTRPISGIQGGLGSGAAWGNPSASNWGSIYGNGTSNGAYGHQVYGNGSVYGQQYHQYDGQYNQSVRASDFGLASPLLFNSSYVEKQPSSYSRTPPNGQGG